MWVEVDLAELSLVGVCGTLLLPVAAADDDDALFIFTVKLLFADDVWQINDQSNSIKVMEINNN